MNRTLSVLLLALCLAASGCEQSAPSSSSAGPSWWDRISEAAADRWTGSASVDAYLRAETFQLAAHTFDNAEPITMWGFSECNQDYTVCGPPTSPGPTLQAQEGGSLTIHLRNAVTGAYVEPVSLVVPGQIAAMSPVFVDPSTGAVTGTGARPQGDYTSRVRSFAAEAASGATADTVYTLTNLRAGTYLYQSGTHPAVQMQMGLFGGLYVYPATQLRAYDDASTAYDSEVSLIFSEIDPVLHAAIAAGKYGPNPNAPNPPPAGWLTSTIDYHPRYFLMNGRPFTNGASALATGVVGKKLLLRALNAGLDTKVPLLQGAHFQLVAEDGNFYAVTASTGATVAAPREQYSMLLPAGKTLDAILPLDTAGRLFLYDRRLNLSNAGATPGGLLAFIDVTAQ